VQAIAENYGVHNRMFTSVPVRQILTISYIKTIILPRQARDKHRENSKSRQI
jgi:hypothetical protein